MTTAMARPAAVASGADPLLELRGSRAKRAYMARRGLG